MLAVPRAVFERAGEFQGLLTDCGRHLESILSRENNLFIPRSKAEDDPSHKQIIPYAVFVCEGEILHYVRGGSSGEKRLVAKASIGIGGHVNDSDEGLFSFDAGTYHAAVRREIAEELRISCKWTERIAGMINDDSTEVGRVHLGVVHLVDLESRAVEPGEKAIARLGFSPPAELRSRIEEFETWSQFILRDWDKLAG